MQTAILEDIIKIQPRGVVTIPKKLRKGTFEDNKLVKVTKIGRKLILEPVRILEYPVRSYTDKEVDEFIDLDEKETQVLKAKGLI